MAHKGPCHLRWNKCGYGWDEKKTPYLLNLAALDNLQVKIILTTADNHHYGHHTSGNKGKQSG
jgi:hypothetical protein